jgi:hypothetical protein
MDISINAQQKLFVLKTHDGFTCFGFNNARDHAALIAKTLHRSDLDPSDGEYGTEAAYRKYEAACSAWASSVFSRRTFFMPGTPDKVAKVLERYRRTRAPVRLFLGDTQTGRDWCEENDVVGTIGRSTGSMKVPLLLPFGDCFGGAILTASVIRIMDVESNKDVWRTGSYQLPDLQIQPCKDSPGYAWEVVRDAQVQARFKQIIDAGEYVAFLQGDSACNRADLRAALRQARRAA